ncbi:hypothetical protein C4D60_Mb06t33420 [Musa balbisiana]|uniref:Uncharacterized protein n=1 Tax=Musa balbisiana TaxID=52838 RepID=A0A4S8ISJ5_MUSBA|nr:hypothetical protein C4D60_Mb06t33420 [Musa balbisiana]
MADPADDDLSHMWTGAAPQEGNKGDEMCSDVSFPQTTASSFDPTHPAETEAGNCQRSPIPCGSSVSTQPQWHCRTPSVVPSYPYKQPHQSSKRMRGEEAQHARRHPFLQNPLHIANLIVGEVGPSSRPDLCVGARRCRLSLALQRSFLPTRTTVLDHRETSRDAARDPRHPDPRTELRRPRGHGLNSCPPQQDFRRVDIERATW